MIHEIRGYRNTACLTLCFFIKHAVWHNQNLSISLHQFKHYIFLVWILCMPYNFQKLFSTTRSINAYKFLVFMIRFSDIYWYSHLDIAQIDMLAREKNLFNIISTASIQGMKYNIYIILQTLFFCDFWPFYTALY